jgi:hypothetical protein
MPQYGIVYLGYKRRKIIEGFKILIPCILYYCKRATFNLSVLQCLMISEIANVSNGPGDMPAVKPRKKPITKNFSEAKETIIPYLIGIIPENRLPVQPMYRL